MPIPATGQQRSWAAAISALKRTRCTMHHFPFDSTIEAFLRAHNFHGQVRHWWFWASQWSNPRQGAERDHLDLHWQAVDIGHFHYSFHMWRLYWRKICFVSYSLPFHFTYPWLQKQSIFSHILHLPLCCIVKSICQSDALIYRPIRILHMLAA